MISATNNQQLTEALNHSELTVYPKTAVTVSWYKYAWHPIPTSRIHCDHLNVSQKDNSPRKYIYISQTIINPNIKTGRHVKTCTTCCNMSVWVRLNSRKILLHDILHTVTYILFNHMKPFFFSLNKKTWTTENCFASVTETGSVSDGPKVLSFLMISWH